MNQTMKGEDPAEMPLAAYLESGVLNCLSCSGPMTSCRLLPCLDSLCQRCLMDFLERAIEQKSDYFVCPACSEDIPVPKRPTMYSEKNNRIKESDTDGDVWLVVEEAVTHFKRNIFYEFLLELVECTSIGQKVCDYCSYEYRTTSATGRCMDCRDNLCDVCSNAHRKTKLTRQHKIASFTDIRNHKYDSDLRSSQHLVCPKHKPQQLTIFCERCSDLLCADCKLLGHDDHQWVTVAEAGEKVEKKVAALHSSVRLRIPELTAQCRALKMYMRDLGENAKKVAVDMEQQAQCLHAMVEVEKKKALGDLQRIVNEELRNTEIHHRTTNKSLKGLISNDSFLKSLLSIGKRDELMYLYPELTKRLSKVVYIHGEDLKKKLKVEFTKGVTSEQNIQIIFGKVEATSIGSSSKAKDDAQVARPQRLSISAVLPSVGNSVQLIREFEAACPSDTKDIWPSGLAVTSGGDYVIVDRGNRRVKVFDQNGSLISDFGGSGNSSLRCPFDVSINENGDLAISDYESEDVKLFDMHGNMQRSISGDFKYPRGIHYTVNGSLAIVDCNENQLLLLDANDAVIATLKGKDDNGFPHFSDPYYVSDTRDGNIVVTDWSAPNLKIFSQQGHLLAKYGTYGCQSDQSLQPYGVCVDEYGFILLADNTNHRIHLLLPDGSFLKFLLTRKQGLWHPMALAIDKQGHLVITQGLGQVKVFKYI